MPRPALPVLAGLLVGVLFLTSNIWALHNPQPHRAPIAVAADATAVQQALDTSTPGG